MNLSPVTPLSLLALLSILISAIVALAGIIIAKQTEKLRTMREQLSEKKYKAYADAVKMFYSILKDAKAHRTTKNDEMMGKMIDIKRDIFMYGSDKVFKAFNTWLLSTTFSNDKAQFAAFLDFVLEMRKDLCNGKTKLTKHDILLNLTQSDEEGDKIADEITDVARIQIKEILAVGMYKQAVTLYPQLLKSMVKGYY